MTTTDPNPPGCSISSFVNLTDASDQMMLVMDRSWSMLSKLTSASYTNVFNPLVDGITPNGNTAAG